jgi:hypothetical protein
MDRNSAGDSPIIEIVDERDRPGAQPNVGAPLNMSLPPADPGGVDLSTPDLGPIELVREGMRVIDAAGDEIGEVALVKMGDPDTITVGADAPRDGGLFQDFAEVFGYEQEPDLPPALRERYLRRGFIKVEGAGLFGADRYVPADQIASVSTDAVRLRVAADRLTEET